MPGQAVAAVDRFGPHRAGSPGDERRAAPQHASGVVGHACEQVVGDPSEVQPVEPSSRETSRRPERLGRAAQAAEHPSV
jgi:hypothetical protein